MRIERKTRSGWRRVTRLRANGYGIFTKTMRTRLRSGSLRARLGSRGEASRAFSLRRPRDRSVNPFGTPTCGSQGAAREGSLTLTATRVPVDQYIEEIPTVSGSIRSGGGGGTATQGLTLPPSVTAELVGLGEDDAATLEKIAPSAALGAPQTLGRPDSRPSQSAIRDSSAASAVGRAFVGEGGPRMIGLLAAMGVIGTAVPAAAVRRARRGRSRAP